jgi:SHAQKYF class myb-like DNA-binding protein
MAANCFSLWGPTSHKVFVEALEQHAHSENPWHRIVTCMNLKSNVTHKFSEHEVKLYAKKYWDGLERKPAIKQRSPQINLTYTHETEHHTAAIMLVNFKNKLQNETCFTQQLKNDTECSKAIEQRQISAQNVSTKISPNGALGKRKQPSEHEDHRSTLKHVGNIPVCDKNPAERNLRYGRWSTSEKRGFITGLTKHGKDWKRIKMYVSTRSLTQIRTHAQKYFKTNGAAICERAESPTATAPCESSEGTKMVARVSHLASTASEPTMSPPMSCSRNPYNGQQLPCLCLSSSPSKIMKALRAHPVNTKLSCSQSQQLLPSLLDMLQQHTKLSQMSILPKESIQATRNGEH